jgi:putative DNA primase/helicase
VALHGDDLRYCHPWAKWLAWDGARWRADDTGEVRRRAKDTVQTFYAEAAQEADDNRRRELTKHALRVESNSRIEAMVSLAESEPGVAVSPDQLDSDPWLLNLNNGTLDLRTGKLREHRREDLISKLAPVAFDPQAESPTWDKFLNRIFGGNAELIRYVRRAAGYAMTGVIREHVLHLLHGTGANGKSTFLNTVQGLLGDYAKSAAPGLLTRKYGETHPTEIADLRGARFVASIEVEEGKRLAEVLAKQLTGGDVLKARRMREDFWQFQPTFKLFLAANHRPEIRGTDHAIWRRIRLVPFTVTIPETEQDRQLGEKLAEERSGIVNWAARGCLEWQRQGLAPPAEVTAANEGYRRDMDLLAHFLEERCVVGPREESPFGELYGTYVEWAEHTGERPLSRRAFGDRMTERGFTIVSRGGGKYRRGVRVRRSTEGRRGHAEHDDHDDFLG